MKTEIPDDIAANVSAISEEKIEVEYNNELTLNPAMIIIALILGLLIFSALVVYLAMQIKERVQEKAANAAKKKTSSSDSTRHVNSGSTEGTGSGTRKHKKFGDAYEKEIISKSKTESKLGMITAAISQSFSKEKKENDVDNSYDFKAKEIPEKEKDQQAILEDTQKIIKKKKIRILRNYKRAFNEDQQGKLKFGNQEEEEEDDKTTEQREDKSQQICSLCKRNRPVFTGDDQLRRLPESTLSPFLKQLKIDSKEK